MNNSVQLSLSKLAAIIAGVIWLASPAFAQQAEPTQAVPQQEQSSPATNAPPTLLPSGTANATNNTAHAKPASDEPVDLAAPTDIADERGPLTIEHELPAAIQFLARMASINIHFDPSLSFTNIGPVTIGPDGRALPPMVSLRWENVRAEDALTEVLDIHGLMLMQNPKTGISRVVKKPTEAPRFTSIVQLQYSNPTNIAEIIRGTFFDPNKSKVNADTRTSQLILYATEQELEAVTNLVSRLDSPTRQVLIEARLLETAKNPRSIKGIDWSGTLQEQNFNFGNGNTTGTTTTQTPGQPVTTTLPSGRTVTTTPGSTTKTDLTTDIGFGGVSFDTARGFHPSTAFLNADGVQAVLSFLNTDADTEVVATPRQVTADNQTATLAVTRAFPIFEITPGTAQTPPTAKITYTNLGTILKVTPRINANSNINLKVVPEVSNIDSKDRQIINGDINEANVYAIRRMETEVVIPSGNTLVMGGLISDSTSKSYTKVPVLGDLPGIGLAFRRDTKERRKSNLLIFITPTIVQDDDFQKTETDFLKTKPEEKADKEESAWDRGKPYDWKKAVKR